MAGVVALAWIGPPAMAESTSSQTSTKSTVTVTSPSREYSASKSKTLEKNGTVVKKSETYKSPDPVTGESSSKSSTTVESPDGSTSTHEKERTTYGTYGATSEVEKRTSTTTSQ